MDDLTEVEVTENNPLDVDAEDFVGRKFYVATNATPDGITLYPLYDANKQEVGIKVKITEAN